MAGPNGEKDLPAASRRSFSISTPRFRCAEWHLEIAASEIEVRSLELAPGRRRAFRVDRHVEEGDEQVADGIDDIDGEKELAAARRRPLQGPARIERQAWRDRTGARDGPRERSRSTPDGQHDLVRCVHETV